jgi:hypothetical protein
MCSSSDRIKSSKMMNYCKLRIWSCHAGSHPLPLCLAIKEKQLFEGRNIKKKNRTLNLYFIFDQNMKRLEIIASNFVSAEAKGRE